MRSIPRDGARHGYHSRITRILPLWILLRLLPPRCGLIIESEKEGAYRERRETLPDYKDDNGLSIYSVPLYSIQYFMYTVHLVHCTAVLMS